MEGDLKRTFIILFCLILPMSIFANIRTSGHNNDQITKYSSSDMKIARRLYQVWRELKNNKEKTLELVLLKRAMTSKSIFFNLLPLVNYHYSLVKLKKPNRFKSLCMKQSPPEVNSSHGRAYSSRLSDYCQYKFLKIFSNKKTIKNNMSLVKNYLHLNIDYLTLKKHKKRFNKFLKLATQNKAQRKIISKIFYKYYLALGKSPYSYHVKYLNIDSKFNNLIASNKMTHTPYTKTFRSKLYSLSKKIVREYKGGQSIDFQVDNFINFSKFNEKQIGSKYARKRAISLALSINSEINERLYFKLLGSALAFSKSKEKDDIRFYFLLNSFIKDDYKKSLQIIAKHKFDKEFEEIYSSKLKFWIAKTYHKNGYTTKAKSLYKKLIDKHPLSFYSIISIKVLKSLENTGVAKEFLVRYSSKNTNFDFNEKDYSKVFLNSIKRMHVWLDLSLDDFISFEYSDLLKYKKQNIYKKRSIASNFDSMESEKHIFYLLLKSFNKKRKHLYSFKFIHQKLYKDNYTINSKIMDFLFPYEYWRTIKKKSRNINPILILSLIRQESAFNPRARSSVGAQGLMQIMLPTARQYGKRISRKNLTNPHFNIKIGVKYLRRLIKKFDNNLIFTLAAYNAGETIVRKWRRTIPFSKDPIVAIEQIPYKETRNYVKLIYRNIFFYKYRNKNDILSSTIDDSFKVSYL